MDYSQTAFPIFQQSCFACHGPKPQSLEGIQDPALKKKMAKAIRRAQREFPMEETFPFPGSDDPQEDLTTLAKSLRKGWMPPKNQKALGMGQPLSTQDKKALLDWVARAQKGLK